MSYIPRPCLTKQKAKKKEEKKRGRKRKRKGEEEGERGKEGEIFVGICGC